MSRRESDIDLESLLANGRGVRPVRDAVRERTLARARAAARTSARPPLEDLGAPSPRWSMRAIAPAAVLVAGVAGAAFAFGARWSQRSPSLPAPPHAVAPRPPLPIPEKVSVAAPGSEQAASPKREADSSPAPGSTHRNRSAPTQSSYATEIELLRRAHAAYASRDFASTLLLVAEHSRRFPGGILAEEREALRVRSLAGAGRSSEAQRAAKAFGKRFPRSVLLPQLQKIAATE